MNRYVRAGICAVIGLGKFGMVKFARGTNAKLKVPCLISPNTEITIDRGARLSIGSMFKMRSGSKLRVRKGATLSIGNSFSMSNNCVITAREQITIGNSVQFGPGVLVYDHDHDYSAPGGLSAKKYKTQAVEIGDNVWIGANCIILRGSKIEENCVVAAGTVIKGHISANSLVYQERLTKIKQRQIERTTL